jgi:hypothetical protein
VRIVIRIDGGASRSPLFPGPVKPRPGELGEPLEAAWLAQISFFFTLQRKKSDAPFSVSLIFPTDLIRAHHPTPLELPVRHPAPLVSLSLPEKVHQAAGSHTDIGDL